jgi:hypothetical protein
LALSRRLCHSLGELLLGLVELESNGGLFGTHLYLLGLVLERSHLLGGAPADFNADITRITGKSPGIDTP